MLRGPSDLSAAGLCIARARLAAHTERAMLAIIAANTLAVLMSRRPLSPVLVDRYRMALAMMIDSECWIVRYRARIEALEAERWA